MGFLDRMGTRTTCLPKKAGRPLSIMRKCYPSRGPSTERKLFEKDFHSLDLTDFNMKSRFPKLTCFEVQDDWRWRLFSLSFKRSPAEALLLPHSFHVYQKQGITTRFSKFYTAAAGYFSPSSISSTCRCHKTTIWPQKPKLRRPYLGTGLPAGTAERQIFPFSMLFAARSCCRSSTAHCDDAREECRYTAMHAQPKRDAKSVASLYTTSKFCGNDLKKLTRGIF